MRIRGYSNIFVTLGNLFAIHSFYQNDDIVLIFLHIVLIIISSAYHLTEQYSHGMVGIKKIKRETQHKLILSFKMSALSIYAYMYYILQHYNVFIVAMWVFIFYKISKLFSWMRNERTPTQKHYYYIITRFLFLATLHASIFMFVNRSIIKH
jgi:hypothetical protein